MRRLYNKFTPYFLVFLITIFSTLLLWLPFLSKQTQWVGLSIPDSNFHYVYRHYDGPLYIIAAKTLYDPKAITNVKLETDLSPLYFAAHLPLYPLLIRLFAPFLGYLKSMIFVDMFATIALALLFFSIVKSLKLSEKSILLTTIFLFLPRFLVVRSIGAPESLFIFLILSSIFFFEKKKYFLAGLLGGLAAATKTPGILLFGGYALTLIEQYYSSSGTKQNRGVSNGSRQARAINWHVLWLFLIPAGFLAICLFYQRQFGDFFAYFHSGDNIHLMWPFAAFNFQQKWVGTAWLEDIIFYFALYGLAVFNLWKSKYRSFFYFSLIFFTATLFVQHRDISRYSLPLWPLAAIAFERFFTSKQFLIVFILILIPASYFYGWNFMLQNVMPISNWAPFM